jgi:hypothetical protein
MRMYTLIYAASHRTNINGPHVQSCGGILKQWVDL